MEGVPGSMEESLSRPPEHGAARNRSEVGKRCREQSALRRPEAALEKAVKQPQAGKRKTPQETGRCQRTTAGCPERLHRSPRLRQRADLRTGNQRAALPPRPASKKEIDEYKAETATVEFPDGSRKAIHLPATGGDLQRNPRRTDQAQPGTGRCAEAGDRSQGQDG